jgi:anti-sigma factor RsiW
MPSANCPSHDELQSYVLGQLSDEASETIAAHFGSCPQCKAGLAALDDADDTLVAQLRRPVSADPCLEEPQCQEAVARARAVLSQPSSQQSRSEASLSGKTIGEYQLLEELGHGGMGTVYKALHTKLDRVVAIKLLGLGRE